MCGAREVEPGEGQADQPGGKQAGPYRTQDARGFRLAGLGRQRPAQDDEPDDEPEDPELEFGEHGHNGQRRGRLSMVLLKLA